MNIIFFASVLRLIISQKNKSNVILLFGNSMFCTPQKNIQKFYFIPNVCNMCVYFLGNIFPIQRDSNLFSNNPTAVKKGSHLKLHYVNTLICEQFVNVRNLSKLCKEGRQQIKSDQERSQPQTLKAVNQNISKILFLRDILLYHRIIITPFKFLCHQFGFKAQAQHSIFQDFSVTDSLILAFQNM